jgi:hypothetical protein
VTDISLGNIVTLGYVFGSDDGIWLGDLLAEGLRDTLGRTLWNEVLGITLLCRRLGRSLEEIVGTGVPDISIGNIETLGYVLESDDGIWLGDLLVEGLGDTLGRSFGSEVLGISLLCGRLGPSSGDTPFSVLVVPPKKIPPVGSGVGKLMGVVVAGTTVALGNSLLG